MLQPDYYAEQASDALDEGDHSAALVWATLAHAAATVALSVTIKAKR